MQNLPEKGLSTQMYKEASEAAVCVGRQSSNNASAIREVAQKLASTEIRAIITCARGSSSHATVYGKYLIEPLLGKPVSAFSPSVASIYGADLDLRGIAFLVVSQSGRSEDLIRSTQMAKNGGALTIGLINVEDSPLSQICDISVPLLAGEETSVAATKSFICSLSAFANIAFTAGNDQAGNQALLELPSLLDKAWSGRWDFALPRLTKAKNLYVTSRGAGFGVAKEAALKLKETSGLHAEALSAAELRHGPMAVVSEGFPILAFVPSDEAKDSVSGLISYCSKNGANCLAIGEPVPGALNLDCPVSADPRLTPIVQIQRFYRLANALSVARGKNPDDPPFLKKVTVTV